MKITEKFELPDGVTVLACKGYETKSDIIGKKYSLMLGGEVRQTLTISGERKMLNQQTHLDQRAFYTRDIVNLSSEEARSENWQLVVA